MQILLLNSPIESSSSCPSLHFPNTFISEENQSDIADESARVGHSEGRDIDQVVHEEVGKDHGEDFTAAKDHPIDVSVPGQLRHIQRRDTILNHLSDSHDRKNEKDQARS